MDTPRTNAMAADPMGLALAEAAAAGARGEVPVGAVVLGPDGAVLASAGNETEARADASAHAELLALRAAAAARGVARLPDCDLVVTLEPCPMCAQAASLFRIRRLVFAAYDPKGGGVEHGARVFAAPSCHHRPEVVGGVREQEAQVLLRGFFAARRGCAPALPTGAVPSGVVSGETPRVTRRPARRGAPGRSDPAVPVDPAHP
ncbi:MAG: nucleoside deaminase [Acetobacteraceae bacterium]